MLDPLTVAVASTPTYRIKGSDAGSRHATLPIGGKILDEIDAAIRLRGKPLLIVSEHSIESDWVEDEVTKAFEEERRRKQIVLFPIRLDNSVMDTNEAWAAKLRARNIADFTRWKEHNAYVKSFERVSGLFNSLYLWRGERASPKYHTPGQNDVRQLDVGFQRRKISDSLTGNPNQKSRGCRGIRPVSDPAGRNLGPATGRR